MAIDKKISELASGAPAQASDEYVVARGAANYKLTLTNIAASMPPIGATTPNTASFTTLTTSSTVTLNGGTANGVLYLNGSKVATSGSALTFDGTNLGLGVTPSAWGSIFKAIQGTGGGAIAFRTDAANVDMFSNAYYNGTNFIYQKTGYSALRYRMEDGGTYAWFNAPSGTAGNTVTFTQAMTLDSSGRLGIGTTSPGQRLVIAQAGDTYAVLNNTSASYNSYIGTLTNDTRIGNDAVKPITFYTDGTERARITAAGNLAIGTTTAATKVQIFNGSYGNPATSGTTQANGALRLSASGTTGVLDFGIGAAGTNQWIQATDSGGLGSAYNLLLNPNGGNVGIGTLSPVERLTVAISGTSDQISAYRPDNTSGALFGYVFAANNASNAKNNYAGIYGRISANTAGAESGDLTFYTRNAGTLAERARISSGGCLGVGDTNPSATALRGRFVVPNGTNSSLPVVSIVRQNNDAGGTGNPETGLDVQIPNTYNSSGDCKGINVYANQNLAVNTYGIFAEAGGYATASTKYSGYFKITQPDTNGFGVNYSIYAQANATIGAGNNGYSIGVTAETSNYVNNVNFYAKSLYTGSSTQTVLKIDRNASAVGSITTTTTATAYNTSSDYRLKENIASADDAGSIIDAIQIVKHDWKIGGHTRYGVIAQDLNAVVPEAVAVGDADDVQEFKNPWAVDYSKLVPILVKEIQSLRARVSQLETK